MTEEHKRKIGLANKGKIRTEEVRNKIRNSLMGRKNPEHSKKMKGRKNTEEHNKHISEANIRIGKRPPQATKEQRRSIKWRLNISNGLKGKKNPSWKNGKTPINSRIRRSLEMRLWKKACLERDNFTDQKTGIRGGELQVHHINNFINCLELRTSIENGITFSKESHELFHKIYGFKNNSREQVIEFINN